MGAPVLTGIQACEFDAYGTLFDFAAAARACRDDPGPLPGGAGGAGTAKASRFAHVDPVEVQSLAGLPTLVGVS
jgi:hypothetical protein